MFTVLKVVRIQIVCLIMALNLLCSCSDTQDSYAGGPCTFESFSGTATFTELKPVTNGIEVYFDLTLSDPTASVKYLNNNGIHLQFSTFDGDVTQTAFTDEWLTSKGISVGVTVPAEYQEIRYGSCSPGFISFPTITGASGG